MSSLESKAGILIVDDDLASLRVLSALLTDQGYQVRGARDGPTALMIALDERLSWLQHRRSSHTRVVEGQMLHERQTVDAARL